MHRPIINQYYCSAKLSSAATTMKKNDSPSDANNGKISTIIHQLLNAALASYV